MKDRQATFHKLEEIRGGKKGIKKIKGAVISETQKSPRPCWKGVKKGIKKILRHTVFYAKHQVILSAEIA